MKTGQPQPFKLTLLGALMMVAIGASAPMARAQTSAPQPGTGQQPFANTAKATMAATFASKTPCDADAGSTGAADQDIKVRPDANFNVMFHGNRFVIAQEITTAFEAENPGVRVSYTAIPPINTIRAVRSGGTDAGSAGSFMPDVVMGPRWLGDVKDVATQTKQLEARAMYSRVHGLVLMARAGDARVAGNDWMAIVKNGDVKVSLPGEQPRQHVLVHQYAAALGEEGLDAMKTSRRVGVSSIKHHRAIPARIEGKCEDVGLQFAQSKVYWNEQRPGVFKFIDVSASEDDLALEDSYVFTVAGSKQQELSLKFARFMTQPKAVAILTKYSLQP